jgi:hypothetical protein
MKHLSGSPLYGRLLASPANIRLGWKRLAETNTLAIYENLQITAVKSFIVLPQKGISSSFLAKK